MVLLTKEEQIRVVDIMSILIYDSLYFYYKQRTSLLQTTNELSSPFAQRNSSKNYCFGLCLLGKGLMDVRMTTEILSLNDS